MKVLDLFSGCGGFSLGFQQAGYEIIGFVEWWQPAITTFLKNHPHAQLIGRDIRLISDETLSSYCGRVDIIVGGPPCQGFSLCGKRDPKDKRNSLYKEYLRAVKIISPKYIVMENVAGILNMKDGDNRFVIDNILHDLIKLGYLVSYKVLTSSDYGVPQKRQRLIIIGKKEEFFPLPNSKEKTVAEGIINIPDGINGHVYFDTKKETVEKIKLLQQGERLYKTYNFSRQRLYANRPSKTITTKPLFIHPYEDRFLTPRELARLQSFPDDFHFCGSKSDMVKQIGNAVPPLMAQAIAEKLLGVDII